MIDHCLTRSLGEIRGINSGENQGENRVKTVGENQVKPGEKPGENQVNAQPPIPPSFASLPWRSLATLIHKPVMYWPTLFSEHSREASCGLYSPQHPRKPAYRQNAWLVLSARSHRTWNCSKLEVLA